MGQMLAGMLGAVWLGVLTSIAPCPLATNIAAISFIGRRVGSPRAAVMTGLLYTIGRTVVYVALGAILVYSILAASDVSFFLRKYMNKVLGPVLILVGMLLLDLIRIRTSGTGVSEKMSKRVEAWGVWGGFPLGVVFALAFCPGSAALFFGSFLPLALKYESGFVLPALYGLGTALPVVMFAVLIVFSTQAVGRAYNRITQFERWARRITGVVFIGLGVYFCLVYIFRVL